MSKLEELLQLLQNHKTPKSKIKAHRRYVSHLSRDEMKLEVQKSLKQPWKGNNVNGREEQFIGLRGKVLNNWQISRILLSDRTFAKNQKSVKIQAKNTYFSKLYNHRQKNHHAYLYDSQLPKINRLRQQIYQNVFIPAKGSINQYFGQISPKHKSFSEKSNFYHHI